MAMEYVASASATGNTGATNIVITKPTGTAENDVLLVAVTANKSTWTPPSGFTQIQTAESAGNLFRSYLYYKVAGGSEPSSYTFTGGDGASPLVGTMIAIRGCNTSSPIMDSDIEVIAGTSANADPNGTITVTRSSAPSRLLLWRTTRNTGSSSGTFSESSGGWDIGTQAVAGSGTTRYGSIVVYTGDFGSLGDSGGPAGGIKYTLSTTDDVFFMVALAGAVPVDGTLDSSTPSVTSSFAGTRVMPDGPIDAQLPLVQADFQATGAPPSGDMAATLPLVQTSLAGSGVGGSVSATLPSITSEWLAGVEPIGPIDITLPSITSEFGSETRPFGEHVIAVEPEKRAFRITQDDIKAIYPSQVTQQ